MDVKMLSADEQEIDIVDSEDDQEQQSESIMSDIEPEGISEGQKDPVIKE